ncbi:MAG: asparagine synthase (glutamine-hydrolyzing) [Longimicrobiales bacterium]
MCGIAGVAAFDRNRPLDAGAVRDMLPRLAHRGPDDEGTYEAAGVVLGHRRLSIIDVEGGHQPLFGARESTAIVINGEVYNYRELTAELSALGHRFRTRSDSEVVAHAYDRWGLDFLNRLDGMFALALWDGAAGRLVLARDRLGEKPLYYALTDELLIFASELTALRAHPYVPGRIDLRALSYYLALEYVPAPFSMVQGVWKLEPGQALVLDKGSARRLAYWRLRPGSVEPGRSFADATVALRQRLENAVKSRLVSDVPLGVFLSGGIDSSAVAAMAARQGALDTFSIGFTEASFDESAYARRVAAFIGSRHHERILRGEEMPALVPALPEILDEPLGDASVVPTALLSRFAREHVTVALGGDGGDELFAGYPMHQAQRVAGYARVLPAPLLGIAERLVRTLPASEQNFSFGFKARTFLRGARHRPPLNHALWMSSFAPAEQLALLSDEVWRQLGRDFDPFAPIMNAWQQSQGGQLLARATHLDATTYLPNDILMKVDRASMHVGLEVRAPFLARDMVEFAFALPDSFRMQRITGKRLLRAAVRELLPAEILHRPKKGFGIPVAAWLRGPLRTLMHDVLERSAIAQAGFFRPSVVQRLMDQHERGVADHRKPLWTLLVFELWRRHHLPASRLLQPAKVA